MSALDLAAIRAANPLPSIVGASLKLMRAGREWKACCPFHDDRSPSFTIFDGGERFHCFGCGAGGDVLDYVQRLHAVDLREAAAMLGGGTLPAVPYRQLPSEPERDTTGEAAAVWKSAVPAAGTPAEAYLWGRGLHLPIPPTIRFARLPYGRRGPALPCLVARVSGPDGKLSGVQRTYLKEDGSGKADVPTPKLSLGRIRGGAIRLGPVAAQMLVTEGLEDGLTLQMVRGSVVWVAAGASLLPSVQFPPVVRSVVIGADGDAAGERAARKAAEAFALAGKTVSILRPAAGFKDFNQELQKGSAQ